MLTVISFSLMISSQKDLKRKLTTNRFQMPTLSKRFLALERNVQHMVWRCKVYKYLWNSPSVMISLLTPLLFFILFKLLSSSSNSKFKILVKFPFRLIIVLTALLQFPLITSSVLITIFQVCTTNYLMP